MNFHLALELNKIVHNLCKDVPHDIGITLVNAIYSKNWKCTSCMWAGAMNEAMPVMYRGTNWRNCPSCSNIAIPISGE